MKYHARARYFAVSVTLFVYAYLGRLRQTSKLFTLSLSR